MMTRANLTTILVVALIVGGWIVMQKWILPRLGIST